MEEHQKYTGDSPLEAARRYKRYEVVKLLEEASSGGLQYGVQIEFENKLMQMYHKFIMEWMI